MKINTKAIYDVTFSAILKKDPINKEKKSEFTIFNKDSKYYIVLSNEHDGYQLFEQITKYFKGKDLKIDVNLDSFFSIIDKESKEALLISLISALQYVSITPWSMKTKADPVPTFSLYSLKNKENSSLIEESLVVAEAQTFSRVLQDMPSNIMYPESFVKHVKAQFATLKNPKIKIKLLDTKDLVAKKMNLLLAVGQGAKAKEFTPKLLVIEYKNSASKKLYGYVGKGVCFDAGGSNLKTMGHMRWMKFDMSGAAIVAGTVFALAKNKIKTNVVAVMPLVLNLLNEICIRPDDVIKSYSGKTVEIDNTDAEGRLILADSLTYAVKDLGATHLFDIATLTGAMIFSLGETYTGVWSTCDCMWENVLKSSKLAGEQVWRLPFHKEFTAMLKSNVADIANSCTGPNAGSSRAACFLKEFTMDKCYTHFDVAATADKGNVGTGVMLKTLYNLAKTVN